MMKVNWIWYRSGVNIRSSLVHAVITIRVRSVTVKLCLGLRLFTTNPSAVRTFRTHCQWLATPLSQRGQEKTYAVDLAAHVFGYCGLGDSGKAGKEEFCNAAYRVCSRHVVYYRTTGRSVEAEEVLHRS